MSAWERVLKLWAKSYREGLDERVQDLIGMAHADLWYGPYTADVYAEEDPDRKTVWPGFSTACDEIARALSDMPSTLWVDVGCEECFESEPCSSEECPSCEGQGIYWDSGESFTCDVCQGAKVVEAFLEDWVEIYRRSILRAVVGKNLAEYVS